MRGFQKKSERNSFDGSRSNIDEVGMKSNIGEGSKLSHHVSISNFIQPNMTKQVSTTMLNTNLCAPSDARRKSIKPKTMLILNQDCIKEENDSNSDVSLDYVQSLRNLDVIFFVINNFRLE